MQAVSRNLRVNFSIARIERIQVHKCHAFFLCQALQLAVEFQNCRIAAYEGLSFPGDRQHTLDHNFRIRQILFQRVHQPAVDGNAFIHVFIRQSVDSPKDEDRFRSKLRQGIDPLDHSFQIIPPIVVMVLLMLSFNLVADGLREALDPKMKSM